MLFVKKGWIESGQGDRETKAPVLLEYRVLTGSENDLLLKSQDYAHTRVAGSSLSGSLAALFQVTTNQLAEKGLVLCSQDSLKEGELLEITITVPRWKTRLRLLGRIAHILLSEEMKEVVFSGVLHLTAAHQGDLKRLTEVIERSKT
jgi:hypothetical protein